VDSLSGGEGDDTLVAEATVDGADRFFGGAGIDTMLYNGRSIRVEVRLDVFANDGEAGEGDFVGGTFGYFADVERVFGNTVGDLLAGDDFDNDLFGLGGDDTLAGGRGDDVLSGGANRDLLGGGDGDDELYGGDGRDELIGGADDDDHFGGTGDDLISSVDNVQGNDTNDGGPDRDVCWADFADLTIFCE
jgi:Ca2+-binding RTX toxin-like protein